ncbi:hypothetical protein K438DRAFT_1753264 [Mycena galopus ATCC 62051]|nr:hypothetical protein K438DRAFT_1753264 [Mycena galopus ATCC 62051]
MASAAHRGPTAEMDIDNEETDWSSKTATPDLGPRENLLDPPEVLDLDNVAAIDPVTAEKGVTNSVLAASGGEEIDIRCVIAVDAAAAQRNETSTREELRETRSENTRLVAKVSALKTDVEWKDRRLRSYSDQLDEYKDRSKYSGGSSMSSTPARGSSVSIPSTVSTPAVETMVLPQAIDYGEARHSAAISTHLINTNVDADVPMDNAPKQTVVQGRTVTAVFLLPSEGRNTPAALGGRQVEFDMRAPPLLIQHSNIAEGAGQGFPANAESWHRTHQLQLLAQYYVYALRHFILWLNARAIPMEERTTVQRLAVQQYVMPDWFANTLSAVGYPTNAVANREAREFWKTLRRDDIGYDPTIWVGNMQYRELENERGCRPMDNALTFNMRLGRGYNLVAAHGLESPPRKPEPASTRAQRVHLDKLLFQVIGTPGLYARRRRELRVPIARTLNVRWWPIRESTNITIVVVVKRLAEGGTLKTIVDDVFGFAQSFVKDEGKIPKDWSYADMQDILAYADGYTVHPPPLFPAERDPYPVSPFLPSIHEFVNLAKFNMSNWATPELAGLRREPGSEIARKIATARGLLKAPKSTGQLDKHNPFLKARLTQLRAEAHNNRLQEQVQCRAPAAARIREQVAPAPTYHGMAYGCAGLEASIHNPDIGLSSYDAFTANASLRSSFENMAPMCVDPKELGGGLFEDTSSTTSTLPDALPALHFGCNDHRSESEHDVFGSQPE